MHKLIAGQKLKVSDITSGKILDVRLEIENPIIYDFMGIVLNSQEKIISEQHIVYYGRKQDPDAVLNLYQQHKTLSRMKVNLAAANADVRHIALVLSVEQKNSLKNIGSGKVVIAAAGTDIVAFDFLAADFEQEKSVMLLEFYFKDVWRLKVVAQGFNEGLSKTIQHYGGKTIHAIRPVVEDENNAASGNKDLDKMPVNNIDINLEKVVLQDRGDRGIISLKKTKRNQPIHINLNWDIILHGFADAFVAPKIDLDLGCMYEMQDGSKGVIQALGRRFGSAEEFPYIYLDHDDRSGISKNGENLYILRPDLIQRVLIYAYVYEGILNFQDVDGRLSIKDGQGQEIYLELTQPDPRLSFCTIALIENESDGISNEIGVTKEVLYFSDHKEADEHYEFDFSWKSGKK